MLAVKVEINERVVRGSREAELRSSTFSLALKVHAMFR